MGQGVQGTRLAGVGTPGEGDFEALVIRTLIDFGGAEHEGGLLAQTEDGILELHGISDVGGARNGRGKQCRFRFSDASI
ncbi:hypothetical protein D3C76_1228310 [compost metagenome]